MLELFIELTNQILWEVDKKVIKAFEELEEGNLFYAERLQAKYSLDKIEVIVVVYEEAIFN